MNSANKPANRLWQAFVILSNVVLIYCLIDFLTVLFSGQTIGSIAAGESGFVTAWVVSMIPGISPLVFVLINIVAVILLSFAMAVLLLSLAGPEFWYKRRPKTV